MYNSSAIWANQEEMMRSFDEFSRRPEMIPLVDQAMKEEAEAAAAMAEARQLAEIREKVLASDLEVQRQLAPFLDSPLFTRLIGSMAQGDKERGLSYWANNPHVLRLLHTARRKIERREMEEQELEELILRFLKVGAVSNSSSTTTSFEDLCHPKIRVNESQLTEALNEQMEERRQGNELYRRKDYSGALNHYHRADVALDVLDVNGCGSGGLWARDEILRNKIQVLLNMAAVYLAMKDFGAATKTCDKVLDLDPYSEIALIRRARAQIHRGEYDAAVVDIELLRELGHDEEMISQLQNDMNLARCRDRERGRKLYKKCFESKSGLRRN